MVYEPTVWRDGQPPALEAANLNKIEAGIKGADDAIGALPKPGQWEQSATWAALPATGNWPGRRVHVLDGLGLCLAVWDGAGWRIDEQSYTGTMTRTPRPEFIQALGGGTIGAFWMQRCGRTVNLHLRTAGVGDFPGSPGRLPLCDIQGGWGPGVWSALGVASQSGSAAIHLSNTQSMLRLDLLLLTGTWTASAIFASTSWPTTDPWPTAPPA